MTFNVSLGKSCKSKKECVISGICAAVLLVIGVLTVLFTLLLNLDYIAAKDGNILMLAAIENTLPWLTLPYTLLICIGIFTTIVGYLWSVGRRFGKDGSYKQRIAVILLALIGITVGSFIPLDKLVNIILPIAGYVGMAIFVCIVVTDIRDFCKKKSVKENSDKQQQTLNSTTSKT